MDANAIAACTAALQDLLGPDVVADDLGWRWFNWRRVFRIYLDGDIEISTSAGAQCNELSSARLDKLHAASTIVRRMAGEAS